MKPVSSIFLISNLLVSLALTFPTKVSTPICMIPCLSVLFFLGFFDSVVALVILGVSNKIASGVNACPRPQLWRFESPRSGCWYITVWGGPASQFTSSPLSSQGGSGALFYKSTKPTDVDFLVTWSLLKSSLQIPRHRGQLAERHNIRSLAMTLCLLADCPFCKHAESGRQSCEPNLCKQTPAQSPRYSQRKRSSDRILRPEMVWNK